MRLLLFLVFMMTIQSCAILPFGESAPDPMEPDNLPPSTAPAPIRLGMQMSDVKRTWGAPQDVETAGDGSDSNQRWAYTDAILGRYGMGSTRYVYFERGRVVGWEMPR